MGPALPWMDAGGQGVILLYSATGERLEGREQLPAWLQEELSTRLSLFESAPRCFLDEPNETSWSAFGKALPSYLAGERFPLPRPATLAASERCRTRGEAR
jgi:hypothetical protein